MNLFFKTVVKYKNRTYTVNSKFFLIPLSNESSVTQTLLNIIMSDSWRYVNLVMRQT